MGKVIKFGKREDKKVVKSKESMTYDEWLTGDIEKLCKALDCSPERAIEVASDFYTNYPMLVEHVRSPEFMLRK
jgi:predicted ATP-grasp superfamily ATP-dependent carboligase